MWDVAKVALWGSIALNAYIRRQEKPTIEGG